MAGNAATLAAVRLIVQNGKLVFFIQIWGQNVMYFYKLNQMNKYFFHFFICLEMDFPQINYMKYNGKPYTYCYGGGRKEVLLDCVRSYL